MIRETRHWKTTLDQDWIMQLKLAFLILVHPCQKYMISEYNGPVHKGVNHVPKAVSDHDRSASWLGLWFELRAFTSIATAGPVTNRICTLQCSGPVHKGVNHVPKELCIHKSSESGFLGGSWPKTCFKSLIWKRFAFTEGKTRLSNQERVRITIQKSFWNVIYSFVNRPNLNHHGNYKFALMWKPLYVCRSVCTMYMYDYTNSLHNLVIILHFFYMVCLLLKICIAWSL